MRADFEALGVGHRIAPGQESPAAEWLGAVQDALARGEGEAVLAALLAVWAVISLVVRIAAPPSPRG